MQKNITVKDIHKYFGKRKVLRGVHATINTGEVIGLLGPNGSGKTTLFYIVAGLLFPNAGKVLLDNHDIKHFPMYKRARLGIGYLPQDISIFRGMNVEENIESILQLFYKNKAERKAKLDDIIKDFSIEHIRKTPALALSGGERRRVEIARAIASSPRFILLDEPFAGVDPIAVGELMNLIITLKNKGIGVLITDHNAQEMLRIVDRAYILYDGQIIFEGNQAEIMKNEAVKAVYLGSRFDQDETQSK